MRTAVIFSTTLGRLIYNSDDEIRRVRSCIGDRQANWGETGEVAVRLPRRLRFTGFRVENRRQPRRPRQDARLAQIARELDRATSLAKREELWREYHALHAQLEVTNPGFPGN